MELLNNSNIQSMFTQLGTFVDDEFVPSDDCYRKFNQFKMLLISVYLNFIIKLDIIKIVKMKHPYLKLRKFKFNFTQYYNL